MLSQGTHSTKDAKSTGLLKRQSRIISGLQLLIILVIKDSTDCSGDQPSKCHKEY